MDRRSEAAIQKMGVEIDAKMTISHMPVGHKQFTEIARELSKEQLKLLILDEPTAVLTEKEAEALLGDAQLALAGQAADAQDFPLSDVQADVAHRLAGHVHPQVAG